jgi:hypothetical protein
MFIAKMMVFATTKHNIDMNSPRYKSTSIPPAHIHPNPIITPSSLPALDDLLLGG